RVDDLVVFHPLSKEQVAEIAVLQVEILQNRLLEQQLRLTLQPPAIAALVAEGYDPVYGARPLKRVIQKRIENPLASKLLAGSYTPDQEVVVNYENGDFLFNTG
ncbi:MAG: type VI secretion system ATPase TssH, partial [Pseudomonadales bacterium]